MIASFLLHALFIGVALLVRGGCAAAPSGGGRPLPSLAVERTEPAPPEPPETEPPLTIETPPPPEPPADIEPPEPETPTPLDAPPPPAEPPPEETALPPPPPTLADAARRVRSRHSPPPEPAPAPASPARPAAADALPAAPSVLPALQAIEMPDPPLPASVPRGLTLTLWLDYTIGADGRIRDARISASSGYPELDASTADFVVRRWRYVPPGSDRAVRRRFVFQPRG